MRLSFIVLRNGVIGGFLLGVLSLVLSPVLYYLTGYPLLLLIVSVVACTASAARKNYPAITVGRLVLVCWGAYIIAIVINYLLQLTYKPQGGGSFTQALKGGDLLIILLLGGVLSALVVLGILLGKRILGKARQI